MLATNAVYIICYMEKITEQIDDQRNQQSDDRLAQALGISEEELKMLNYKSSAITAGDIVTAYEYQFSEESPRHILEKIQGLSSDNTIQLGVYDLEKPQGT